MMRSFPRMLLVMALTLGVALVPGSAGAHTERDAFFPDGSGEVPTYRTFGDGPTVVACAPDSRERIKEISDPRLRAFNQRLLGQCDARYINDALAKVTEAGTNLYLLPGTYDEKPYRDDPECAGENGGGEESGAPILSYQEQLMCPHAQNLIPIFGDMRPGDDERKCDGPLCDLQIEGTGASPEDVLITGGFDEEGQWAKLNGIRGDRADGLYLKNFTIELFEFNAVYILETDGFVIDEVVGRYNDEYAFLTFAVDHGLYKDCEGYGNGDSAIYPGSASDVNSENEQTGPLDRYAIEIKNCNAHHNALGYSGTAGNSVYAHDNTFHHNGTGIATDSVFPNHPGLPQNHAWFTDNDIYANNVNYYEYVQDGTCDKPPAERGYEDGVVCPVIPAPVGTGMLIAGGNYNYLEGNRVYDNWRNGFMLFGVPAALREEMDPSKQFDTSNFNHFVNNLMGLSADGEALPNGLDFWWDDQGEGNCWQDNVAAEGAEVTDNSLYPGGAPDCDSGGSAGIPLNLVKQGPLVPCATYDREDNKDPLGCDWFVTPDRPQR